MNVSKTQKFELVNWEDVRRDMKYKPEDNNNGLIYGLYFLDEDGWDIEDVMWFETAAERLLAMQSCGDYDVVNE